MAAIIAVAVWLVLAALTVNVWRRNRGHPPPPEDTWW